MLPLPVALLVLINPVVIPPAVAVKEILPVLVIFPMDKDVPVPVKEEVFIDMLLLTLIFPAELVKVNAEALVLSMPLKLIPPGPVMFTVPAKTARLPETEIVPDPPVALRVRFLEAVESSLYMDEEKPEPEKVPETVPLT